MKEPWSISKDKLVDLEEGTSHNEEYECAKPARKNVGYKQAMQGVKLFLSLGLLMIVGWACYLIWQPYHAQSMEVKVTASIQELESQNLILLEEQATQETSTIAARSFYESEDTKQQDVVDNSQIFLPDDQDEILNSENTESSLDWPTSTDYPDLPKEMNFPFFLPSFSNEKVDESEKEPGSSESAQEKSFFENYMLFSLVVQNSMRISEALKDSKEVVDPKFQLKLEDLDGLKSEDLSPLGFKDSSRLELDNSSPLQWFSLGPLELQKEIGSDLKDSEEKPIPTQTNGNYGSTTSNILKNAHEIVPVDSTEPEQEAALIKSNEQMHQSIDSADLDWLDQSASEDRKHEEEQSLLEKSTVRNAEASEDSTQEVDYNLKVTLKDLSQLELDDLIPLEMKDSGGLESEGMDPFEWEYSDLDDSEEKSISTQTDDNYGSTTSNILKNAREMVPEDSTEPEQEETLVKSNEHMHQSIDSADLDWLDQSASEDRKHEEEQSLLEKSIVRNAEASEDSTQEVDCNLKVTLEDLSQSELDDSVPLEMKDSGALESEGMDPFEWEYSDLDDSEEKPISIQTDDNYGSTTSNILKNAREMIPEDSTEPEQEETLVKSNEQMHQSIDSADMDWLDQSTSEDRKHEEEQATDETEAEIEDDKISPFVFIGNIHSLGLNSDTSGSSLEYESDEESESDSFDFRTYQLLLRNALSACRDPRLDSWEQVGFEDLNNSYASGALYMCNVRTKKFCAYRKRTLKLADCSKFAVFGLRSDELDPLTQYI